MSSTVSKHRGMRRHGVERMGEIGLANSITATDQWATHHGHSGSQCALVWIVDVFGHQA